jgi:glyoxylase-like metal-dependent hydrolase (beta-lactamase superfamily II)
MSLKFAVGDLTIHRIVELDAPFEPARQMLPGLTAEQLEENRHWLQPDSLGAGDVFNLCYQSYVVRTPHHVILVDTCLGNDKPRARAEWHMKSDATYIAGLAAVGLSVDDIDYVLCTHLHGDHVGWNTRRVDGRWVPTFPKARYVFGRREVAATEALHRVTPSAAYADSVLPVVEAGRAELVDDDHRLGDHVRLLPTPGHTDGHVAVSLGKGREDAVMTGDLIHVPLQMRYPELSFARDRDPIQAAVTRRAFLERLCDTPALCCTSHFPSPSVGRVKRWGPGFRLASVT